MRTPDQKLRRIPGRLAAMLAGAVALLLGLALPTWACEGCPERTVDDLAQDADVVAHAKVIQTINDASGSITFRVTVEEVWKGSPDSEIAVYTPMTTACGIWVDVGDDLLLFAQDDGTGYTTQQCDGTKTFEQADAETLNQALGQPATMTPTPSEEQYPGGDPAETYDTAASIWPWLIGGGAAVVLVGIAVVMVLNGRTPQQPRR